MEISRERVLEVIIHALEDSQAELADDEEDIEVVTEKTIPIGGLAYFDSLESVKVTSRCLDAFEYDVKLPTPTIFIDNDGKYLTVGEIADKLLELLITANK